ncbi:undecaprenyl-diphosphatase UppP [Clostridium tagluense]|uniref:Undecaprenyl-diphosphatase n=1 Tax=Clostridium tagluense TaxID=360422 RepID=A0A401UPJ3_9CLOT|nr:undecaprenyl-diphosphatase UppP [Clostridium tagluense]GCD11459.1 undecaprenyl-diphosphatase [Clostridium tagluense]
MNILQAIVYGIVQGIGEFLPISSTAHLVLIPWIFGWNDPGVAFDVALHLGTSAAVILFFWKDWIKLINAGIRKPKSKDGMLFWLLVLATIPGGLFGVLLDKYMEVFRNPALIGVTLIILGIILYYADKNSDEKIKLEDIGLKRSLIVGISQIFAIIPGVSRSGITMSAGRYLGMEREAIAKFTFLLSTPIIIGDALYHATKMGTVTIDKTPFIVAVLTAAVVGFLSIKFLLNYLKTKGFGVFSIYRFVLGVVVIVTYFARLK